MQQTGIQLSNRLQPTSSIVSPSDRDLRIQSGWWDRLRRFLLLFSVLVLGSWHPGGDSVGGLSSTSSGPLMIQQAASSQSFLVIFFVQHKQYKVE